MLGADGRASGQWNVNAQTFVCALRVSNDDVLRKVHFIVRNFVRLVLMRWRMSYLSALVASIALIVVFAWHPRSSGVSSTGISAPAFPATTIESGFDAKTLVSQYRWYGNVLSWANPAFVLVSVRTRNSSRHHQHETATPDYCPLQQRPPPNFS
jgi:hypothetical protein